MQSRNTWTCAFLNESQSSTLSLCIQILRLINQKKLSEDLCSKRIKHTDFFDRNSGPDTGFDPSFAKLTENICAVQQNHVANQIRRILTVSVDS